MSEITDIRYFTDGEQATAAVLNRPVKDLAIVDSVMSKVQFEANAAARREQYAGSGFVEWGKENFNTVNKGMYIRSDEKDHLQLSYGDITKVNINGNLTRINAIMNNTNTNVIRFPQASSAQIITDSANAPAMKQGDFAILKDLNREVHDNPDITSDTTGEWIKFKVELEYDSSNNAFIATTTDASVDAFIQKPFNFLKGVKYRIEIDIEGDLRGLEVTYTPLTLVSRVGTLRTYEFTEESGSSHVRIRPKLTVDASITLNSLSIKQVSETPIVALQDTDAGDIYTNASKFEGRDSISRQDLVFLETWHENIADKDIVYPYGNIQYKGNNTDGLSGIADGTFTGAGTYSLFGNWQSENDLVGKGYKWSDLSLVDKVKFASNHDNNVYRDGNNWVQVRYRIRVVQGLGNDGIFDGRKHYGICLSNGSNRVAVKGPATLACDNYDRPNGLPRPYNKYIWSESNYNERHQQIGTYSSDDKGRGGDAMALPIASVQRRNVGIYDESFNPEGTAKVYVDGAAVYSYETNLINSMDDCFDRGNIAAINPDNGDVSRLSAGTEGHVSTGSIASGVSGRPDGIYYDEVNERDVEDLRMSAHKRNYDELREEYKNKAISGSIRGKEVSLINTAFKLDDRSTAGWSKSVCYSHNTNAINTVSISTKVLLDSKGHMLDSGSVIPFISRITFGEFSFPITYCDVNQLEFDVTMFGYTETQIGKYIQNNITGTGKFDIHISHTKSFTYNNTLTHCDIIGDPRQIQDRVSITTVNGDDQTATINKNTYVKANDNYYRSLVDRGSITVDPDTEDYTNTDNWIDLGNDGTVGGYKQEWLDYGMVGTPLIVGENGESLLPVDGYNGSAFYAKMSRKFNKFLKCIILKKDGTWFLDDAHTNSNNTNEYGWSLDNYSDLGYASEQEMLDLMIVKVYYETKANFLELVDNNSNILSLNNVSCINGYGNHNHLINSSINKVSTGESSGYIGTSGLKLYATRPEGGFATETSWSSYVSPTHDSKLFGNKIPSNSPMIKFFDYLTVSSNRARLQFVFKELKYDTDSSTWGDDNKFQIIDKISTVTDQNGNSVLYGQKAVNLPYFIGGN